MTDIREVIETLRREIEAGKRDLDGKEAALKILEQRFSTAATITNVQTPTQDLSGDDGDLFDLSSLEVDAAVRKPTFVDNLRDVLRRFGSQEFNIAHAEAALKRLGIEIAGKTPRSRISASLSRLNEDGFIVKTFEGGGNVPHKYKLRSAMSNDEVAEAEERLKPKHKRLHETVAQGGIEGSQSNGDSES